MIPTLLSIGPLTIHSFGLFMVLTFVTAWRRLELSLAADGFAKEHAEPMVFWAALGGILGARFLYLLANFSEFLLDPLAMLFSGAGFIFYGGFFGGFLGVVIYLKRNKLPFLKMADIVAPSLALGYAVGRIGCQLSGDSDYGIESDLPWSMSYALGAVPTPAGLLVHPAPVYETLASFTIACLLIRLAPKLATKPGCLFGIYLLCMSIERFLVEFVRIEPKVAGALTQAQVIAIGLFFLGLLFVFLRAGGSEQSKSS